MKAAVLRNILLFSPVLLALAAAVLILQAGAGDVNGASMPQAAMMSIPF
jgi:hypothetical protein